MLAERGDIGDGCRPRGGKSERRVECKKAAAGVVYLGESLAMRELRIGHRLLDGAIWRGRHPMAVEHRLDLSGRLPPRPLFKLVDQLAPIAPPVIVLGKARILNPLRMAG